MPTQTCLNLRFSLPSLNRIYGSCKQHAFQGKKRKLPGESGGLTLCDDERYSCLFRELFTNQIPVVLPASGLVVGGFYSIVFIVTAVFKILIIEFAIKLFIKGNSCRIPEPQTRGEVSLKNALSRAFRKEFRAFLKIAGVYLVATTIIFVFQEKGAFEIFSVLSLAELLNSPRVNCPADKLRS